MNAKQLNPGDTCIACVHDGISCVGVVVEGGNKSSTDPNNHTTNLLILGWFGDKSTVIDYFGEGPVRYPFPSYSKINTRCILPYSFDEEIAYCNNHNEEWWTTQGSVCTTNLIATNFFPVQNRALSHIALAKHILNGGDDIVKYKSWTYTHVETFLHFWGVLNYHFPNSVKEPPSDWNYSTRNPTILMLTDGDGLPIVKRINF